MLKVAARNKGTDSVEEAVEAPEQATSARKLVVFLLKELHHLGNVHIDAVEAIAGDVPKTEAAAVRQLNDISNSLVIDQGDAVSIVHDGAKHLLPAFRFLAKSRKA